MDVNAGMQALPSAEPARERPSFTWGCYQRQFVVSWAVNVRLVFAVADLDFSGQTREAGACVHARPHCWDTLTLRGIKPADGAALPGCWGRLRLLRRRLTAEREVPQGLLCCLDAIIGHEPLPLNTTRNEEEPSTLYSCLTARIGPQGEAKRSCERSACEP